MEGAPSKQDVLDSIYRDIDELTYEFEREDGTDRFETT